MIATPSKFEIRHESPKKPVGRPPKATGIRDKLKPKAARPVGRPVGSTKVAKLSVKSKNIQKAKDLLKKKHKEKKDLALKKKAADAKAAKKARMAKKVEKKQ